MTRAKLITLSLAGAAVLVALTAVVTWRIATRNTTPAPQQASADEETVYPSVLRGGKSLEVGELVLLLMPDEGTKFIDWDYRVDSPIRWQTTGFTQEAGSDIAYRFGFVRANIQGRVATILRRRRLELGWSVEYRTDQPAKFGPQEISVQPGAPEGADMCFGTGTDGCDFEEPIASMVAAGIHLETICTKREPSTQFSVWLAKAPTKRPTILVWETSGGSGGSSASLTLKLNDSPDQGLCDKYAS